MAKTQNDEKLALSLESIGQSGLDRAAGYVLEEKHPKLSGLRAIKTYREMADNDATVGAILYAIETIVRQVEWRVEPANETDEAKKWQEFLEGCLTDMSHTWEDFISEVITMFTFGWSWFEEVYKIRRGPDEVDPRFRSKHTDGLYGWRKLALRAQESWDSWQFQDDGGIAGMFQRAPPAYQKVYLPIEKCLLFRTRSHKNNPEGRSLLRNGYRSWYFIRRMQEIEAVGIERDLSGLPVARVPPHLFDPNASDEEKAVLDKIENMVVKVRRDEREGVVFPAAQYTDDAGNTIQTGYDFGLMSSGGKRAIDTDVVIQRYQRDLARTLLADFIFLGSNPNGSRSLADNKTDMFVLALGGFLDSIEETFHNYGTARLMKLNNVPQELWPRIKRGDTGKADLAALGAFLKDMTGAGLIVHDPKLERFVREKGGLPQLDPGEVDERQAARPGVRAEPDEEEGDEPTERKPPTLEQDDEE